MDKGLLIYKIDSNKFYLDQQDKELTKAYNYFIQKLRELEPALSTQYADDNEFIDCFYHNEDNINKNLKDLYWEQYNGIWQVSLMNSNMETFDMPDFDSAHNPTNRAIWFGVNWKHTADLNDYKEQLKDYLPDDFPFEKYYGGYSMIHY